MSSKLFTLSTEILVEILYLLQARDIIACSKTCRHLATVVLDQPNLQYIVSRHCAYVEDDDPPPSTTTDRLERLRRWEESWKNLDTMAPSGGRFEHNDLPIMRRTSMLRDGYLIVPCYKNEIEDRETPGYSMLNLRSPNEVFRHDDFHFRGDVIAFEFSIEQNFVVALCR
jgi:F-box domain